MQGHDGFAISSFAHLQPACSGSPASGGHVSFRHSCGVVQFSLKASRCFSPGLMLIHFLAQTQTAADSSTALRRRDSSSHFISAGCVLNQLCTTHWTPTCHVIFPSGSRQPSTFHVSVVVFVIPCEAGPETAASVLQDESR